MASKVKVGTQFRTTIADGRPLFEVESIKGDVVQAVGVAEYVTYGGREVQVNDWYGNGKRFLLEDVEREVAWAARAEKLFAKTEWPKI